MSQPLTIYKLSSHPDFMKRLSLQVENIAKTTASLTSTLMLIASGRMARVEVSSISRKIDEVKHLTEILPVISKWIEGSIKELSMKTSLGKDQVRPGDIQIVTEFKRSMDAVSTNFAELYPIAKSIIQNSNPQSRLNTSVLNGNANTSSLVHLSGKCLQVTI
jgi:predicted short-subunit dehydrogenase-like oxidoreductase (DUF2520 family)